MKEQIPMPLVAYEMRLPWNRQEVGLTPELNARELPETVRIRQYF